VHKEVTSAGARLDQFLNRNGVGIDERVTLISDDAGEFEKAVRAVSWLAVESSIGSTSR
jgi:hypothetical protein